MAGTGACALALAAASVVVVACGGGGSGGSTPPTHPTATPSGQPPNTLSCTNAINLRAVGREPAGLLRRPSSSLRHTSSINPSTYNFASNPSGLTVYVNQAAVGSTSYSYVPTTANQPYQGVIKSSTAQYGVCYSQLSNGTHTIYWNTQADTSGAIGTVTASAFKRAPQHAHVAFGRRMPIVRSNEQIFDTRQIQVRFVAAAIGNSAAAAAAIERGEGAPNGRSLGAVRNGQLNRIVALPAGVTPQAFAQRMRRHHEVAFAAPLPLRFTQSTTPFFPNDQFYDDIDQWDLFGSGSAGLASAPNAMAAPYAWGYTHGSSSINLAIIDTGADLTSPDLSSKVTYEVAWVTGESPYPNHAAGAAQDEDGHGTNVSGIAGADTNNTFGVAGTGFNSSLQEYRIFPVPQPTCYTSCSGYGASTADEASAIYDAIAHNARVINLSLGSCQGNTGPDPTEFDAVETAISKGVTVVAAAGNERSGGGSGSCGTANSIDFPGAYPGVIAVGATSLKDPTPSNPDPDTSVEYVASYSNSGPGLAVVAPGGDPTGSSDNDPLNWITNLYSTTIADPSQRFCSSNPPNSPCLAEFAGTSQATPHVTGLVGLMLARGGALSPARIKSILEATADNINDPNQGFGRVDGYRALAAVTGDTVGLPKPPATSFVAIAYTTTAGSNKPNILNQTFTGGVPLALNGSFRLADVLASAPTFKIGLWYDANGDGIVDAGDYFGGAGPCSATAPCSAAATINVTQVTGGFVLH
jgi:subtilisin family serine protease